MGIADDYLALIDAIGERLDPPPVQAVHVAPLQCDPQQSTKFGALVLADQTVGLTYAALDGALESLQDRALIDALIGVSPLQLARLYAEPGAWQRVLGLAAINAVSQYLLRASGFAVPAAGDTLDHLALHAGDRVGLVGYFPPLVKKLRALGLGLTVVELDPTWLAQADGFEVTLDPARLAGCNKIVCTGTVLLNQTLDSLSAHWSAAEQVFIAGPTVGCLPEPLFARGITLVGGTRVTDYPAFLHSWASQRKWRGATRRYLLRRTDWPGYRALLSAL